MADAPNAALTETIVREVLRRLQATNGRADSSKTAAATGELVLSERLVTLDALDRRIEGIQRLVVPAGALITPAVRDELRRRDIEITTREKNANTTANDDPPSELLLATTTHESVAAAVKAVDSVAATRMIEAANWPQAVVQLVVEVVNRRQLGLIVTDRPAAAVCLANRQAGVRAAAGHDLTAVRVAVDNIAANVLVVDPKAHNLFQLKAIIREFTRGGWRKCPAEYQDVL